MNKVNHGLILLLITGLLSACQPDGGSSSKVSIRIPTKEEFNKANKVSAMAAVDYSNLCFAVNVKGGTIPLKTPVCDVGKGVLAGAVAPGSTLEVDVPYGENISFEIYGLLRANSTEACVAVSPDTWNWPVTKIYLLGKKEGVNVREPKTSISIGVSMPDLTEHIVAQSSMPASCEGSQDPAKNIGRLQSGASVLTGTQFKLYSKVSNSSSLKPLSGSQYKIRQWKAEVD